MYIVTARFASEPLHKYQPRNTSSHCYAGGMFLYCTTVYISSAASTFYSGKIIWFICWLENDSKFLLSMFSTLNVFFHQRFLSMFSTLNVFFSQCFLFSMFSSLNVFYSQCFHLSIFSIGYVLLLGYSWSLLFQYRNYFQTDCILLLFSDCHISCFTEFAWLWSWFYYS